MSEQPQHVNLYGNDERTAEDWEKLIQSAVDTIPDSLIRVLVITDPYLEYYIGVNHMPLRQLSEDEHNHMLGQMNDCRPHCFEFGKSALRWRIDQNVDNTEDLSDLHRCKRMNDLIAYAANQQHHEVLDGLEEHIAICPLCGPIVALFRTAQTQPELTVPPSR